MEILSKEFPNPKSELIFNNNFQLLIAVMLSAQATDKSVNNITKDLFNYVQNPNDIIELGEDQLYKQIKKIGLAKTKSKHIFETSKLLKEKFNNQVPSNFDELISLPGVGSKTANVVLNVAFHLPTIAVDTHIFRVAHRLNLSNKKNPECVSKDLTKIISEKYILNAHHYLLLHGRYTCKARNPLCNLCKLINLCKSKDKKN